VQSDALQIELRPQTFRGSRYAVADLARIEPVFYRGKVWCVEVPSGVFIARRKGLVFLTGNTGFPKSRALLKPAAEHWILIKAPGELRELRIDESRIEGIPQSPGSIRNIRHYDRGELTTGYKLIPAPKPPSGRWPANFALSHCDDCTDTCVEDCPVRLLDEQSGILHARGNITATKRGQQGVCYGKFGSRPGTVDPGDSGGASRFFYQAKPSTKERSLGLPDRNTHPTVKSIALMRHLIRLIAAPGSLILDPFTGSGSTAVAAIEEGCRFVGIEQDSQHAETARLRAQHALANLTP
jgi:site-specific DNA-methyltransferase (adenine-specific)